MLYPRKPTRRLANEVCSNAQPFLGIRGAQVPEAFPGNRMHAGFSSPIYKVEQEMQEPCALNHLWVSFNTEYHVNSCHTVCLGDDNKYKKSPQVLSSAVNRWRTGPAGAGGGPAARPWLFSVTLPLNSQRQRQHREWKATLEVTSFLQARTLFLRGAINEFIDSHVVYFHVDICCMTSKVFIRRFVLLEIHFTENSNESFCYCKSGLIPTLQMKLFQVNRITDGHSVAAGNGAEHQEFESSLCHLLASQHHYLRSPGLDAKT